MRRRAHYVLSTHWDREWYLPAQRFRRRLVRLLDEVLAGLADGRLGGPFTSDGQAIMLEDYLEVRPERRAELEALVRAGRLVVGPWYTVPDEFLVSGESLVRNLRLGRQVARDFGGRPSAAGWVCDQFGHIGQLPQIFVGFSIRGAFLWRGVNHTASRHFRWRGADGTVLPTYRFGDVGYCSFAFRVRRTELPDHQPEEEELWENLERFLADEAAHTEPPPLLIFDGGDHLAWDPQVSQVIGGYGRWADAPFALVHSSLDAYLAELLPHADAIGHEVAGELREPAAMSLAEDRHWLIPGVLSSRVWIKQENAACESLLTQWAEPLSVWAHLALRHEYPRGLLDVAWRWLLQNHPHDSMGGCSVDLVHEDMRYRFSQCRQIADELAGEAATALAAAVGEPGQNELRVVVFNPLARPLAEPAELDLEIPAGWPAFNEFFGFEPQPALRIFGPDGAEMPYQRLGQAMGRSRTRLQDHKFPDGHRVHVVRVSLPLELPALGYAALTLRPGELDPLPPHPTVAPAARPTRHPAVPGLATSERSLENEHLALAVEANGTLTVRDKRSGATYAGLLTFEDSADIGDGWYHGQALADEVHSSSAAASSVALVHNGPYLATLRIRTGLRLPARFDFTTMTRSEELVELLLDSRISLRRGCDRVEVETTLCNTAADHRLRVLFPSGARSDRMLSDGAFDVVDRPIALAADNHRYRELEVEGRPQQSWTAVAGGGRGLAVVSTGQLEAAVRDLPERPIALTLLRSTRRTVFTDGEPGGLLLGDTLRFRYWLVPQADEVDRARLCWLGQQLVGGQRVAHLRPGQPVAAEVQEISAAVQAARPAPPAASLLQLDGPLVLTSLLWGLAGPELRLFNPGETEARGELSLPPGYYAATPIDLEGEAVGAALPATDGRLDLRLGPKQILTLRL